MSSIVKKMLKLLAKQMPGHAVRSRLLRWAGYWVGRETFIGEDLIIVDELRDRGMVSIGNRVAIAPRVTLVVSSSPNSSRIWPYVATQHEPIRIDDDAWIGTGAVVLPGITIGQGAVVGANAVVRGDVNPYTIVAGLPARYIGSVQVPWACSGQESRYDPTGSSLPCATASQAKAPALDSSRQEEQG